jgi:hypothetical protein
MALDIRLDFITKINPITIHEMTAIRKAFMEIDDHMKVISDTLEELKRPAGQRTIALARTHLETSLQFAIKSLCIMGEEINDQHD